MANYKKNNRGHKSHVGVGAVVKVHIGFVLDFEVLPNYCHGCASLECKKREGKITEEVYECWRNLHKDKCGTF